MRKIDTIIIHCTATREGQDVHASDVDKWHKERGFQMIGYNYLIDLDGTVETGRPMTMSGAHTKGWNSRSVGVCYVGGLDKQGNPKDTRTPAQKKALNDLVYKLLDKYPDVTKIIGHRDTSPDLNGDGKITPNEWIKACPCFDVQSEFPMLIVKPKK